MKKLSPKLQLIANDITPAEREVIVKGYNDILAETFLDLNHRLNDFYGEKELSVTFKIEKTVWDEYRKSKAGLGALYGVDLGNYLSRKGILKEYAVPQVSDNDRAKNGFKTIRVTYILRRGA